MVRKPGLARLRARFPDDWQAGDKTGTGNNGAVNDIAVVWPNGANPVIVAVLMDGGEADVATHNQAHAEIGAAVATWLSRSEREQQLSDTIGMR